MQIQRLSWAGVRISVEETTILVDPLGQIDARMEGLMGKQLAELTDLSALSQPSGVFITHEHADHIDAPSLLAAFGANVPIYAPAAAVENVRKTGLHNVTGLEVGERVEVGAST